MSAISNYGENLLLDWLLTTDSVTRPTTIYLGLYTAAPTDAGGGTEVSGFGYARQAVTFNSASGGATSNSNTPSFTASGSGWGVIVWVGLFDAVSNGNLLWKGPLASSIGVLDGDTITFPAGTLIPELD